MKNNKDFILKEKLSSKKIFLLENILNNLATNPKEKNNPIFHNEKQAEPTKKKDFKVEIENRFLKAKNEKYIFPKQILVDEKDGDSSLESLKNLGVYDLNLQNQKKKQQLNNSSTKKLMESIQRKKNAEEQHKDDFSETLRKMKQSLQEKLKSHLFSQKFNNFLDENENVNADNKSQNASERLDHKPNLKKVNSKNSRTSFSNLHSNFNRSLQQNAQTLDKFFKKRNLNQENVKKMHLLNFYELRKDKQKCFEQNLMLSPKNSEIQKNTDLIVNSIKQEQITYGSMAKKLYRKMQDNLLNHQNLKAAQSQQKEVLSFENPSSELFRKARISNKLQNLTDRNKDSLITSTNKLNEVNDFFNKITKKAPILSRGKMTKQKNIIKKDIKGFSNNPSFNSSSSYSSQRFLNTPISLTIKNI